MGGTGKVSLQLGEDGRILRCFLEPKKPAANDVLIKGGVFNINIASSQNPVSSPESEDPKKMFRRLTCIESNSGSSQEN